MQPKQIQQRQIQQQQIKRAQFTNAQFTRPHNDHQHSMTLSTPRQDNRIFNIPESTIIEDQAKSVSLPFKWLRTWLFSLIALVLLPIGIALIFVGTNMMDSGDTWTETAAEVSRYDESGITFSAENIRRETIGFELEDFVTVEGDTFIFSGSACDLVSRFIIPQEDDAQFTIWVNPADSSQYSCVPVSSDAGASMMIIGWVLSILAGLTLLRTIGAAASAR